MSIALITHPECLAFGEGLENHPEQAVRLDTTLERIKEQRFKSPLIYYDAPIAHEKDILRVHGEAYWQQLVALQRETGCVDLDPDTALCPGTLQAAKRASGAAILAADLVNSGAAAHSFCLTRPPGHHAEPNKASGFCFINHAAITSEWVLANTQLEKVLIIDFDVHQCNGTLEYAKDRQNVKVLTSFQHPWYPNSHWQDLPGHTLTKLTRHSTFSDFLSIFDSHWLAEIELYQPDFIIVSAGFDAHEKDPLGELEWTTQDYFTLGKRLQQIAHRYAHGRMISILEGGYDPESLAQSICAYLRGLSD